MKKWINILGTIGLTATITTTLISCEKSEKPNNNKEENKSITPKPQQPPEGSNWKLINYNNVDIYDEKYYFGIGNNGLNDWISYGPIKGKEIWKVGVSFFLSCKAIYRWDGNGEPETPTINENTGEITDWKEQKGTK
ncbi:Spiroplasmavirus-related protein [Spiroplasma kunkelii CR2-3x]|uniref:Spiroplasmavirus-related protein n=1 Tax=Spiroplasma kunkelii CR2-3x TaxID=273035 RepID=A0A0K2JIS2_SPIKU|nr:lipoprotein [Spiroplasma kunkelii]ALA98495.1 Spiroplasmavirus-related protein [Spiroplasma kunkelii CR2-3x]